MKNLTGLSLFIVVMVFLSGCGLFSDSGTITGNVINMQTGKPLKDVQIIIALKLENEEKCKLLKSPTTRTDINGDFTLSNVPPATYNLMYALPDELSSSPKEWGGVIVGDPEMVYSQETGKFEQKGKGPFWDAGWEESGSRFYANDHSVTTFMTGRMSSNRFGISFSVEDYKKIPEFQVLPNDTINWDIQMSR